MTRMTITLEVASEAHAVRLRKWAALLEELDQVADTAEDGHVLEMCEQAVVERGRDALRETLEHVVQRRSDAAEKKGRRRDAVPVVAPRKTAARLGDTC